MRWVFLAVSTALLTVNAFAQSTISSTFDVGIDGWSTANDAKDFRYVATGGNPGGHIAATDIASGGTYYFVAPSKFHGNLTTSYNETLSYDVKTSAAMSVTTPPPTSE